ncbi:MAG: glycosyltransferase family 4 protein, partial [Candidatus Omnitrophica bacterium]|nr:glycosyltransferase family 4 protein [Candidatus Omnitrophota bacterium]
MEAQACGLPVVASNVGGLVDLITEGETGYLVTPRNPKALAKKIVEVLHNPKESQKVGVQARSFIVENFSLDQMVRLTEKVYEEYTRR